MSDAEPAIVARGLAKSYSDVRALDGIDLEVQAGRVVGLLGPNGAGKTTAVRIFTTLLEPDEGTARVAGCDVVRDASALRARIGLAGQYAAVDENLTGFENLEMVGRLYHLGKSTARERATELLTQFDLAEAGDRPAKTYSGGSTSPPRWSPARRSSSSTSPPRRSTRAAAARCGRRSRSSRRRARPCS